jgi:hypothetical protein
MQEYIRINIDALSDWMPIETEAERHDRLFHMTDITCRAFGWEMGGDDFFRVYENFKKISEDSDKYHDHLTLIGLMILKDLMESSELQFSTSFNSVEDIHDMLRSAVKNIRVALEHLLFTDSPMKNRDTLKRLPRSMTEVDFTFHAHHDGDEPLSQSLAGLWDSDEEVEDVCDESCDHENDAIDFEMLIIGGEEDMLEWLRNNIEITEHEDDPTEEDND